MLLYLSVMVSSYISVKIRGPLVHGQRLCVDKARSRRSKLNGLEIDSSWGGGVHISKEACELFLLSLVSSSLLSAATCHYRDTEGVRVLCVRPEGERGLNGFLVLICWLLFLLTLRGFHLKPFSSEEKIVSVQ